MKNVLIDQQKNMYLNSFITKDIPPYVRIYLSTDRPLLVRHLPVPHACLPNVHRSRDILRGDDAQIQKIGFLLHSKSQVPQPPHQGVPRNGRSALHEGNHPQRLPQKVNWAPQKHLIDR
jgi:hypothetical protein